MRIAATETNRWDARTAWMNLRSDWQKLAADVAAGADRQVIRADKAALVESRVQVAQAQGTHRVDVTV
jgi:hypothetical protein